MTYLEKNNSNLENVVIYLNWDGFSQSHLEKAWENNKCQTLKKMAESGTYFNRTHTHIPSITNAMQPCIVSGTTPKHTDNHYRYYRKDQNIVWQEDPKRINRAETIAESLLRESVPVLSINQFVLENRGTSSTDANHYYVDIAGGINRIKYLYDYIDSKDSITEFHNLIALYVDEIDSIGHNDRVVDKYPIAKNEEEKLLQIIDMADRLDIELGKILDLLKSKGFTENVSIIFTADHGMTTYGNTAEGQEKVVSSLSEIVKDLEEIGFKVEVLMPNESIKHSETNLVIVTVGLQLQISYITKDDSKIDVFNHKIMAMLQDKHYFKSAMTYKKLIQKGVKRDFADLLISPKPPYHFKVGDLQAEYIAKGQHDSLDESSSRVPLIMRGNKVKKNKIVYKETYNSAVAATIALLLNKSYPLDANIEPLYEGLDIKEEILKTNQSKFSNPFVCLMNSTKIVFEYKSTQDISFQLFVNGSYISDVFFPKTNESVCKKVINYAFQRKDEVELKGYNNRGIKFRIIECTLYHK